MTEDYYQTLGVGKNASDEEIKKALSLHNVVGQSEQFSLSDLKQAFEEGQDSAYGYTIPPFEEWFRKR